MCSLFKLHLSCIHVFRPKACGLAEIRGAILPYIEKKSRKWFLVKDVEKVLASSVPDVTPDDMFKKCNLQPCTEKDLIAFNIDREVQEHLPLEIIELKDVCKCFREHHAESDTNRNEDCSDQENEQPVEVDKGNKTKEDMSATVKTTDHTYMRELTDEQTAVTSSNASPLQLVCSSTNNIQIVLKDCQQVNQLANASSPQVIPKSSVKFMRLEKPPPLLHCAKKPKLTLTQVPGTYTDGLAARSNAGSLTATSLVDTAQKMPIDVQGSSGDKSAFQTSQYLLIPKSYLKAKDSKCVLIERANEKKLQITYVDKQSVSNKENAGSVESLDCPTSVDTVPLPTKDTPLNMISCNEAKAASCTGENTPCIV